MSERDQKIIELYNNDESIEQISSLCNCCITTIYLVLKRYDIPQRPKKIKTIPQNIVNEVKKLYERRNSIWAISKKIGLSTSKINKIIIDNNITPISYSCRVNKNLNENYFEKIDTEEKAYWLGWLITDGCISKGNTISMSLQSRDVEILNVLQNDLGLENKIKNFNQKYYRFSFCNKKMVNDLSKYGIIKNKTFTVRLPILEKKLIPSLLRGLFEGDGGISKSFHKRMGKINYELSFTGNKECVIGFNDYVSQMTGLKTKNVVRNHSIWRVRWSNIKEIEKIMDMIYENCGNHKLDRKYNYLLEIQNNAATNNIEKESL